jgi:hypothetical protein
MKRLIQKWLPGRRRPRTLVLPVDRPRAIDRVIDYFGTPAVPATVSTRPRRKSCGTH